LDRDALIHKKGASGEIPSLFDIMTSWPQRSDHRETLSVKKRILWRALSEVPTWRDWHLTRTHRQECKSIESHLPENELIEGSIENLITAAPFNTMTR